MRRPRLLLTAVCSTLMMMAAQGASAQVSTPGSGQEYPNKLIRVLVSGAGSGVDITARLLAPGLTASLGQQVIVDNRPTVIAVGETVSRATPDGHTLTMSSNTLWIGPLLQKLPYDALKDFSPVILAGRSPSVLIVTPTLPVKSVKELIALAKARPGQLNYASLVAGSANHLAAELFKSMTGTNIVRVTYKGNGPALTDVMAGQVQLMFASAPASTPHIKSGRLKALAVTTLEPSSLLPGLPTVAASGLPGFSAGALLGLLGPAKLPVVIVNRLNQEVERLLNLPDMKGKLLSQGVEVTGGTPDQFSAAIKSEISRLGKVIADAAIREE